MMKSIILTLVALLAFSPAILGKSVVLPDSVESYTRKAFKAGKWEAGKQMLDRYWGDYGDLSVMNKLMGQYYYNKQQYDKSRFYLVRAIREDAANNDARAILAYLEEKTGNYSSAICYINEILERNPYSRDWWRRKINIYRRQGNDVEADRLLERLRQIYPDDEQIRNDVAAMNVDRLGRQKAQGDIQGQIETLRQLVAAYPKETEYYLSLSNLLLQSGRTAEAEEALSLGVRATRSPELVRKRAGIIAEQGRYVEAINYLKSMEREYRIGSLGGLINQLELSAAESAVLNDPYTAMARVYARQKNRDALDFLLNTSIARGYYDDALTYIKAAKGSGPGSEQLQYKEYIVHKRLGNRKAALAILSTMYANFPKNDEVREELCALRYEDAISLMGDSQYSEAIPYLEFVEASSAESDLRRGALVRLYNCYLETKQYSFAHKILERLDSAYGYDRNRLQLASLLVAEGKRVEALDTLEKAFAASADPEKARLIAYRYEEIAQPYIRSLIERGMIPMADKAVKKALVVCPTSINLLHQAITTADLLNHKEDYASLVATGRKHYPEDPFFIIKEARVKADAEDYRGAVELLRPQLETFLGDSALVGAFAYHSLQLARLQMKEKAYGDALSTLDSALVYRPGDADLLFTKGLVFEARHEYDSAYVYLRHYQPSLMEYSDYKRRLEELKSRAYRNEISLTYQQARPGSEDVITANAMAAYTLRRRSDAFTFSLHYAGRDGVHADDIGKDDMEAGGTGIMVGADWEHQSPGSPWSFSIGGAWGSKYFPRFTARGRVGLDIRDVWTLDLHASVRDIKSFTRHYEWIENPEKFEPSDPDSVYVPTRWDGEFNPLFQLGLGLQRDLGQWLLSASVDGFLLNSKLYFNSQLRAKFFPIEGSRTAVFASAGAGTAPQTELLDYSIPAGFSKMNTNVGAGLTWFFNRHLGAGLSGTWYTMYRSQRVQTGLWGTDYSTVVTTDKTDYRNLFYLQAQMMITF